MYVEDMERLIQTIKSNSIRIADKYDLNSQDVLEEIQCKVLDLKNGVSNKDVKKTLKHAIRMRKRTDRFIAVTKFLSVINGFPSDTDIWYISDYIRRYREREERKK